MKSWHVHLWGCKGRQPRAGDLCLTCPAEWTPRITGNLAVGYKPRTDRPTPGRAVTAMSEEGL